jgi:outer membrane protein
MKTHLSLVIVIVSVLGSSQTETHTLKDCFELAMKGMSIKRADASNQKNRVELLAISSSFLPSISITNQHNVSTGRVLDPTTYEFVTNKTVYDMSASIGGSMTLFSGFERIHQVKKAELELQSAELEVERTRNDLALEVTRLFLEILMDKEAVEICENKISLLRGQEELIARKVEFKTATTGDLLNVQADIMRAQVERSAAMGELDMDKVAMCELLEIEDWENFDVTFEEEDIEPRLWNEDDVLFQARILPQMLQKEVAVEQAKQDVRIATASYWPTVRLNAGYGSTFSNARIRLDGADYSFYDQLRDNMSSYVTASISIPILNAFTISHTAKARKYTAKISELEYQRTLLNLDKEIKQAIIQVNTAYNKYQILAMEVEKGTEALRQTEAKYNAGAATYYDYQIAVANLFQAHAERSQARYEYIYRAKIIGYYSGRLLE